MPLPYTCPLTLAPSLALRSTQSIHSGAISCRLSIASQSSRRARLAPSLKVLAVHSSPLSMTIHVPSICLRSSPEMEGEVELCLR